MSRSARKGRVEGKGLELRVVSMLLPDLFMFFGLIQRKEKSRLDPPGLNSAPARGKRETHVVRTVPFSGSRACAAFPAGPPAQVSLPL